MARTLRIAKRGAHRVLLIVMACLLVIAPIQFCASASHAYAVVQSNEQKLVEANEPTPVPTQATLELVSRITSLGTGTDGAFIQGDIIQYSTEITNTGTDALEDVVVEDTLVGSEILEDTSTDPDYEPAYTIDKDGNATIETLEAGESVKVVSAYVTSEKDGEAGSVVNQMQAYTLLQTKAVTSNKIETVVQKKEDPEPSPTPTPTPTPTPEVASISDFAVGWGSDPNDVNTLRLDSYKLITEKGETVQLGVAIALSDWTLATPSQANTTVRWTSSDTEVATVDDNGLVTPGGKNGWVTITASGYSSRTAECSLTSSIRISFQNQEEKTEIRVYTIDGDLIPEGGTGSTLTFTSRGAAAAQEVYAEIDYQGETYSSRDGTGEFFFQVENIEIANCQYANRGSTYVWCLDKSYDGTTQLIVRIVLGGNTYLRYVPINLAAGSSWEEGEGGIVPDSLTINVSWEDDPNPTNPTKTTYTYSLEQLDQMSTEYYTYTIIGDPENAKKYAYQVARGVRLIALLNDCGIYEDDIKYLNFSATDTLSVNSQTMGMQFFLGERYYYPNYYLDRNTSGAQIVPALIAVSTCTYWNPIAETVASKVDTYADIGAIDGTAPRLCIGAVAPYITGGKYSLRNLETINVVLAGAPPENPDAGNGGQKPGSGGGGGEGGGSGGGQGADSGGGVDTGGNAGDNAGGNTALSSTDESISGGDDEGVSEATSEEVASWKIYQMMSTAKTQADITDIENPWLDFLWMIIDVIIVAGAVRYLIWYFREKRPPHRTAAA